ncbi:MAG: Acetoacetyl-CoA synthetase [uncultured Corynebacteriales bacterium]|uniref:Acetoacetyl-CoA synthetase n=1 Tax=uncultured Mycobacteriales bacterium TaxID=581187 RepID=A0A6J4HIB9_9ACTN|nr:MAG: Acetoacetyl-CoA synthetase [uncultured Corynebacteriales bacterium]
MVDTEPPALTPLWEPTPESLERAELTRYLRGLTERTGRTFDSYDALWRWSVEDLDGFWASIWTHFGLDAVSSYDAVLAEERMPGAVWFPGARLNFAERCLAPGEPDDPALLLVGEDAAGLREPVEVSRAELRRQVAAVAATLRGLGVRPGDRVAGYLPNIDAAVVGLLAAAAVGAVWTVASPDFGTPSVLARLGQAEPVVLIAADGYRFGGKAYDRRGTVAELLAGLPSVRHVLTVDNLAVPAEWDLPVPAVSWAEALRADATPEYADTPFDAPLWILWSSGTTGAPKGIVHSHGGIVLELLKSVALHAEVRAGDRFFFVTSTSWMIWNFMVGGLMVGATPVLHDGSPTFPDVDGAWRVAATTRSAVVGCGAGYLMAGSNAGSSPGRTLDLSALRVILQTGSTLPDHAWLWTSENVSRTAQLNSISGGTDVCSALAGANAMLPVHPGRIPAAELGVALEAWDADGKPVVEQEGELVVTRPLPSMPIHFLNDPDGTRYHDSYFDVFPGVWRHGDWITVHADRSISIAGRSDSTLNRMGVRMGSAEIYAVVEQLPEVSDSLVLGVERPDGSYLMPLFVVPAEGAAVDDALRDRIRATIRRELSPRHVPDEIVGVRAVPRTLTGKKLEVPVKRILQGAAPAAVASPGAVSDHDMLEWFAGWASGR